MEFVFDQRELILEGFWRTVQLAIASGALALVFGTVLGIMRVCPVPPLRWAGSAYVNIVRNTPLTLVFVFSVFGLPRLDIRFSFFVFAVIALTVYTSAFVCEVVRSGINTVPVGQAEASRALGFTFGQTLGAIVLPQALRSVVPPLTSIEIALLKNTTIAAGFSVFEAGGIYQNLSERGYNVLVGLLWVAAGFLILVVPLTLLQRNLERRWSVAR